jgi:hypothetical protein
VWKLRIPFRTRISLVVILSLGIFAAAAGIVKQLAVIDFALPDPWIHDRYTIWSFIEMSVGIIAASLPAVKPMFNRFFDAARGISGRSKSDGYKGRTAGGCQKHSHPSDIDDIAMGKYKTSHDVRISAQPPRRSEGWNLQGANNSEDSILPRDELNQKSGGITVTNHVEVN